MLNVFSKNSLLFLLIIQSISSFSYNPPNCINKLDYYRCEVLLKSESLEGREIPLFLYLSKAAFNLEQNDLIPNHKTKTFKILLFLHGRGYARQIGDIDSMLENLHINKILKNSLNKNLIFVAPQDNIYQNESKKVGQEYWIGALNRNWPLFLTNDLPQYINIFIKKLNITAIFNSVIGISMGAHGALMLGTNPTQVYKNIIAISPIFYSNIKEISQEDRGVFLKSGESMFQNYSYGALLNNPINLNLSIGQNYFIETSINDFGLDKEKFPNSLKSWQLLKESISKLNNNNHIEISKDTRGHSHSYWIDTLKAAVLWYQQSTIK